MSNKYCTHTDIVPSGSITVSLGSFLFIRKRLLQCTYVPCKYNLVRSRQLKKGSFYESREATIRLGLGDGWFSAFINEKRVQLNLFGPSITKNLTTFSSGTV